MKLRTMAFSETGEDAGRENPDETPLPHFMQKESADAIGVRADTFNIVLNRLVDEGILRWDSRKDEKRRLVVVNSQALYEVSIRVRPVNASRPPAAVKRIRTARQDD